MAAQGYIGRSPGDSSNIIARQTYTPTGITTNFTFASTYSVGYIDAYLNGVRLVEGNDFTATDGSVVGLTTHAQNGDIIELVAYKTFNATNVTAANNDFSVAGNLSVTGVSTFTGAITATGGITGAVTGDATGLSGTPDITIRNLTGVAATFTGVLSYDDVTNVDSVGFATFRSGINVQGAGSTTTTLNVSGVTTMTGDANFGSVLNIDDSIVHSGDSNTKIRFPAADTFTVETGGDEALRVDSSQRLLVNTDSAMETFGSAALQVATTAGGTLVLGRNDTSVSADNGLGAIYFDTKAGGSYAESAVIAAEADADQGSSDYPSRLVFKTTADGASSVTERLRIDSSGNIGINCTSGGGKLAILANASTYEGLELQTPSGDGSGEFHIGVHQTGTTSGRSIVVKRGGADGMDTESLRINSAGLVGIGTDNPTAPLTVMSSSDPEIKLGYKESQSHTITWDSSKLFINADPGNANGSSALGLKVDGTERLRITSGGNVGINTETPTSVFDVQVDTLAGINFTNQGQGPILDFRANNVESAGRIRVGENSGGAEMLFLTKKTNDTLTESFRVDTSQRVLINTTSSEAFNGIAAQLQVEGDDGGSARASIYRASNDSGGPAFLFAKSRSTGHAVLSDNDFLGQIDWYGSDGTDTNQIGARIAAQVDGTPGNNDLPAALIFSTNGGTTTPTERLRIDSNGFFNVNSANNNNLMGRVTIFEGGNFSTASQLGSGDNDNIYLISDTTSTDGGYGASIAWSRIEYADRRAAAIASVQTTSDEDQVGLAFFTHPSSNATDALVEAMRVDHAGRLLIGSTQRTVGGVNCALHVEGTGADDSSIALVRNTNGPTNPPYLMFGKSRSGSLGGDTVVQNGDLLGYLSFNGADGNDLDGGAAAIQAAVDGTPGSNDMPGRLEFLTTRDGNNSPSISMGINRNGELRIGHNASDPVSTDHVHSIGDPSLDSVTTNVARLVMQEKSGNWISFKDGGGTHYGTISRNTPGVTYGSNSDYRLKDNVQDFTNGINLIKQLRPVTFNWNELSGFDTTLTQRGFLAHEVQEVEPGAVVGDKDEMDRYGNCYDAEGKKTQTNVFEHQAKEGETWILQSEAIRNQQLDPAKLVPILTAALQEAITKIDALETRIAALEG